MIGCQLPAHAVRGDVEPVPDPEVTTQRRAAKPAFETDDMVSLHRAPDRDRRRQYFCLGRRAAGAAERTVYDCDETCELIDSDAVFCDITLDDARDQAAIDGQRCVFLGHIQPNVCYLEYE